MIQQVLTIFGPTITEVLKKVVPDTNKRDEIERELQLSILKQTDKWDTLRSDIIVAEASSKHWVTATWRPMLMYVFTAIIATNYLIFPLISIFHPPIMDSLLEIPDEFWTLLNIGVGGYVVGRSSEKVAKLVSKRKE